MDSKISFEEWLELSYEKMDHSDEPKLLRKLGHFNPGLYFMIIADPEDVKIFKRIDEVKSGSNLILFSAAFFLIYDTAKSIGLSGGGKNFGSSIVEATTKIVPKSKAIIEVGSGAAAANAKIYSNTVHSNLKLLAEASLKIDSRIGSVISKEIGLRILELESDLKSEQWYKGKRANKMITFWKDYHFKLFKYNL